MIEQRNRPIVKHLDILAIGYLMCKNTLKMKHFHVSIKFLLQLESQASSRMRFWFLTDHQ